MMEPVYKDAVICNNTRDADKCIQSPCIMHRFAINFVTETMVEKRIQLDDDLLYTLRDSHGQAKPWRHLFDLNSGMWSQVPTFNYNFPQMKLNAAPLHRELLSVVMHPARIAYLPFLCLI